MYSNCGIAVSLVTRPLLNQKCVNKICNTIPLHQRLAQFSSVGNEGQDGSTPPSAPSMYDLRKFSHLLPTNNVNMYFEPLPSMPTGIFRNTDGEVLGLSAGKCCIYKNPEYFSFHHMTFYDMHLLLRCYRNPSPNTARKP